MTKKLGKLPGRQILKSSRNQDETIHNLASHWSICRHGLLSKRLVMFIKGNSIVVSSSIPFTQIKFLLDIINAISKRKPQRTKTDHKQLWK